ncbi:uncharacterized protein LOC103720399 isoform X2 [Phoenix dactylifera]|uniref:Uncharacterized protein LOC103720399 isoform X2 n=1 Tax=Phoenix dactylifera TaxID=42345 RepID=A0A8B9ANK5_PHODC|nr:uncharacterized protein LOC103720399 isoform X2 [Phoenix dactylifera]
MADFFDRLYHLLTLIPIRVQGESVRRELGEAVVQGEELSVDAVLRKRKVLNGVEKAGLLSKAEQLGFTFSSIEKLGFLSKTEELSLLERAAYASLSALASTSPPFLLSVVAAVASPFGAGAARHFGGVGRAGRPARLRPKGDEAKGPVWCSAVHVLRVVYPR